MPSRNTFPMLRYRDSMIHVTEMDSDAAETFGMHLAATSTAISGEIGTMTLFMTLVRYTQLQSLAL